MIVLLFYYEHFTITQKVRLKKIVAYVVFMYVLFFIMIHLNSQASESQFLTLFQRNLLRAHNCTNQQSPQRDDALPDPVWVGSKWLLVFPRAPFTQGTPLT